jgi:hypothetical protein
LIRVLLIFFLYLHFGAVSIASDLASKEKEIQQFLDLNSEAYKSLSMPSLNSSYQWRYPNETIPDPDVGYRHIPNGEIRHIVRTEKEIVFDVTYHFDEYGRRKADIREAEKRDKFIALFGCSFTYGNAIQDNETLNYFFAKELNRYYPYNYGIAAMGANAALGLAESGRLKKEIPQREGVFLYIFIDSHVNRTVGNLPSLSWNFGSPFYEIVDGQPINKGSFLTGRPITSKLLLGLYSFLYNFTNLGNREFPPTLSKDQRYTCAILKGIKNRLASDFPSSPFYVVKHPTGGGMNTVLKSCLEESGVSLITFSDEFEKQFHQSDANLSVKYDGHPNGLANKIIAAELVKILKEQKVL